MLAPASSCNQLPTFCWPTCSPHTVQAAAMPMRVQRIESTMALLETGDLKLRVSSGYCVEVVARRSVCCLAASVLF